MHCVGGNAGDMQSIADLDKMIAHSLRDVPDDDSDDLSDTDDPDLLVSHSVVSYKFCFMMCVNILWLAVGVIGCTA